METITRLLDECKAASGAKSDYALAKTLDIPTQRISDYYKGTRTPDEYACLQIAKATGKTYEEVSALIRIAAEKDEKRRAVWRDYYKSIGGMAASFLAALTLVIEIFDFTNPNFWL